mmetsp:Transcript_36704/g.88707  ORF Transcript_36704/g.88707 Transcript_36704/m.88707 type:complete len:210 (+) Transcript_36704:3433-4062(+)
MLPPDIPRGSLWSRPFSSMTTRVRPDTMEMDLILLFSVMPYSYFALIFSFSPPLAISYILMNFDDQTATTTCETNITPKIQSPDSWPPTTNSKPNLNSTLCICELVTTTHASERPCTQMNLSLSGQTLTPTTANCIVVVQSIPRLCRDRTKSSGSGRGLVSTPGSVKNINFEDSAMTTLPLESASMIWPTLSCLASFLTIDECIDEEEE